MLYAIGFIGLFTIGGLTGLFLAAVGLDVHVTDTYFIVAHFHYIMVGGTIMGYLGGLHYWWPKISGRLYNESLAQDQRRHHLRRLQPDVLPAVHPRLPRHAAALSRVPAGVPGAERAVVGGRVDSRRRLPDSDGLPDVVAALRAGSPARTRGARSASSGRRRRRRRPRTSRRRRSSRGTRTTTARRWRAMLPDAARRACTRITRRSRTSSTASSSRARRRRSGCGCSSSPRCCSSAACSRAYAIYRAWYPEAFAAASHELDVTLGTINTVVLITSSLTMALAVHAAQLGERRLLLMFLVVTMVLGAVFLGIKSVEYYHKFVEHHVPGPDVPVREGARPARADLLLALLRDDRPARAAHDHRPRHHAGDVLVGVARHDHRASTTARSRSAASTGTSSTSSGSSCSRCCT